MNYDGAFGGRPAPSLAEAMMNAQRGYPSMNTPCTTPNAFSRSPRSGMMSPHPSYSQQPLACRVGFDGPRYAPRIEETSDSSDSESDSENEIIFIRKRKSERMMRNVERAVCSKLEVTLKQHYKLMKTKIKQVQQRVESTDASIERLSKLLDVVTEAAYEIAEPESQNQVQRQSQNIPSTQPPASSQRVMTWRRKKISKDRKHHSQAEIDAVFF